MYYREYGGFELIVMFILIVLFFIGAMFYKPKGYDTTDEACKVAYGQQFTYVDGGRGADLCATIDGETRYYDLIQEKK